MSQSAEIARIQDELHRAYDGDCWHGPPLKAVLAGITAQVAAAKHPVVTHTIWELVNHLDAWVEVVTLRLTEWRAIEEPAMGDFPPPAGTTPVTWEVDLGRLDHHYRQLCEAVAAFDAGRLGEIVPGKDYPVPVMLHGTAQHLAYHAGQIALLKKLVA
ncbi:MAG: DinB family protein [Gemmataceae bacterium]